MSFENLVMLSVQKHLQILYIATHPHSEVLIYPPSDQLSSSCSKTQPEPGQLTQYLFTGLQSIFKQHKGAFFSCWNANFSLTLQHYVKQQWWKYLTEVRWTIIAEAVKRLRYVEVEKETSTTKWWRALPVEDLSKVTLCCFKFSTLSFLVDQPWSQQNDFWWSFLVVDIF